MEDQLMDEGKTLFQMGLEAIRGKEEQPREFELFNPYKMCLGSRVVVKDNDLSDTSFTLVEIAEYVRQISGEKFFFADYILQRGDRWVTVRAIPVTNPAPTSVVRHRVLALFPDLEFPYDKQFHETVLPQLQLNVEEGGEIKTSYTRIGYLQNAAGPFEPYRTVVRSLSEPRGEIMTERTSYWDYEREVPEGKEYYFVEMDEGTGMFQTFRGVEVSEKDVQVFPAPASR